MASAIPQMCTVSSRMTLNNRLTTEEWAQIVQDAVLNRASKNQCLWPEEIKAFNEAMSARTQGVPHETLYLVQLGSDGFLRSYQIKVLEVENTAARVLRHVTVTPTVEWERHRDGAVQLDQLPEVFMAWFDSTGEAFPGYFLYQDDALFAPAPVNLPEFAGIIVRVPLDLSEE